MLSSIWNNERMWFFKCRNISCNIFQSRGLCTQFCDNWAFAILQKSSCWCSNEYPVSGLTESSSCDSPCPGYPYESCGGEGRFSYIALRKVASPENSIASATEIPTQISVETRYETRIIDHTLTRTLTQTVTNTKNDLTVPSDGPNISTTALLPINSSLPASSERLDRTQIAGIIGGALVTALIVLAIGVWSLHRRRLSFEQDNLKTGSVSELSHLPGKLGILRITNPD